MAAKIDKSATAGASEEYLADVDSGLYLQVRPWVGNDFLTFE